MFSGGGGVEALLKQRINFVHAVEYDPAIAAVYRANHGDHIQVADVCDVDYTLWGALDYLHASPVCKEFSQAKTGGVEGDTDINTALAVVRCLEDTQPRVFTLENVGAYQHSKSFKLICRALDLAGYMWHAEVLNSADFGVPQTRRRLILRAVKDALLPGLAAPDPWVGWYAATKDCVLPKKELPKHATPTAINARKQYTRFLIGKNTGFHDHCFVGETQPAMTFTTQSRSLTVVIDDQSYNTTTEWAARITSLPIDYIFPCNRTQAVEVIGNMVPSLMMQKIVEPLL